MNDGKFDEALQTLKTIIIQETPINKMMPLIDKIRCQIEIDQIDDAVETCKEYIKTVDSQLGSEEMEGIVKKCDEGVVKVIEMLLEIKRINSAYLLLKCRLDIAKRYYEAKPRLLKLENIGYFITKIAIELSNRNRLEEIKSYYNLLDEVYVEMQKVESIDLKLKCEDVAWFLMHYGFCCNECKDWDKSIEIQSKAISIMETAYGEEAIFYRVLGNCCNNLGVAYENSGRLAEAKNCFQQAIDIYIAAKDWGNNNKKQTSVSLCNRNLHRINKKLGIK